MSESTYNIADEIKKVGEIIANSSRFLLTCHVHPDGDALGSALGMAHCLKSIGKEVTVSFPEPFVVPENLKKALVGTELLTPPSEISSSTDFDVAMTFDCGSISRLEGIKDLVSSADCFINVDHHVSNEKFGDVNIIDVDAASSGTVVLEIIDACSIELTKQAAQCIYVALLTDTGRFQFSSTTSSVFEQAARLASYDLPIAELSRVLTEEDSFSFLKLAGNVLNNAELDEDLSFVFARVPISLQKEYGVEYDEIEGVIEFVRRTKEAGVACVVKEFRPGENKVSLRSLGKVDVCKIASQFGGGGHKFAAGFTSNSDFESIVEDIKQQISQQTKS